MWRLGQVLLDFVTADIKCQLDVQRSQCQLVTTLSALLTESANKPQIIGAFGTAINAGSDVFSSHSFGMLIHQIALICHTSVYSMKLI